MPPSPTDIVFLGCGGAARTHSRVLASIAPEVRRWYASRDATKAARYSAQFRGAGAFPSYDAALADARPQAALITTTPDTHLELTTRAFAAGKHVVVEKPAFLRSTDFDGACAAERAAGRRLMVGENYCYKPLARAVRALIAGGAFGDVRFVNLLAVKRQRTSGWREDVSVAGGGALFEGGVHWIDLLANLGSGLEVTTVAGFRPGPHEGIERSMAVVVRYANGGVGTLMHSWEIPSPLQGLRVSRVFGTRGSAAFESSGLFLATSGARTRLTVPGLRDVMRDIRGFRAMWTDFLEVIRTGREPVMTTARARRGIEIVEEAYRSAGDSATSRRD